MHEEFLFSSQSGSGNQGSQADCRMAGHSAVHAGRQPTVAGRRRKASKELPQSPLAELFVRLPAETVELATQCSG